MSDTPNLRLPFVAAAQAQKHVTVNEALARIDAALQLNVISRSVIAPPLSVAGEVYLVPDAPTGDWEGISGALATTPSGANFRAEVLEFDVIFSDAGVVISSSAIIPAGCVVFAVTGRILDVFDGSLTDWSLGVAGFDNRYGSGFGSAAASYVRGLTGQPQGYYADTPLTLRANGGNFGNGQVRLAIHLMKFDLPNI